MDRNDKLKEGIKAFLTGMCDLMMLNLLWIVCSLPVVTAGPASCALMAVMLRIADGEPVHVFREFFRAFRSNIKPALLMGLAAVLSAVIIYTDVVYALALEGQGRILFLVTAGIAAGIWMILTSYVFALQARFENTIKGHVLNAFKLAFCAPGRTLEMWLIWAAPILICLFVLPLIVVYIGWILLLFGVSLPAYFNSRILTAVFRKAGYKPEGENDE